MEVVVQLLAEIVFQVLGELLVQAGWRAASGAGRDALGMTSASWAQRALGMALTVLTATGFGLWRGSVVGSLGWGWWLTSAVAVVAVVAAVWRTWRPAGPRPGSWALVRWWPVGRCWWFAVANGAFVCAYALTALQPTL